VACSHKHNCNGNTTMHSVCVVQLHITFNYTKILIIEQQCFYGKVVLLVSLKCMQVFMYSAQCTQKQQNVHMLWPIMAIFVQPFWESFLGFCLFVYTHLHEKKYISCNLNPEFFWLHWEFHSGFKGFKYKTSSETVFSMLNI